jgi:hypothetical protein
VRLVVGDVLELDADPAWSEAINIFLVKKGVMVSKLRYMGTRWAFGSLRS